MNLISTIAPRRSAKKRQRGFTLVEALIAVMFMAIVIPVALSALRTASMAGEAGQRRLVAARIGNRVLNNLKVQNQLQTGGGQRGLEQENGVAYVWTEKNTIWTADALARMIQATVSVQYNVAGRPCTVELSTLFPQAGQ
jgi:type II secretory pathway pseudopilin PulG